MKSSVVHQRLIKIIKRKSVWFSKVKKNKNKKKKKAPGDRIRRPEQSQLT